MQATGNKTFTIVPANFFDPARSFSVLGRPAAVVELPRYRAFFVYDASLEAAPELCGMLERLPDAPGYNKILCAWRGGKLSLAIGQGKQLLLANEYKAPDFTTAEYFIFLALKSLQMNPEVSGVRFTHALEAAQELSLLRYFKSVECE